MTSKTLDSSRGAALITGLVLLMALTVVSIAAMSSTTSQLQLAGNDESRMDAYERAQSIIDSVIENNSAFVIVGDAGYTTCSVNVLGCNANTITFSDSIFTHQGVAAKVELKTSNYEIPRMAESSNKYFYSNLFTITGSFDDTNNDRGKAEVVQGYVILVPKASQGND